MRLDTLPLFALVLHLAPRGGLGDPPDRPLFQLDGEVKGEEFAYYKIMHPGNLLLVLESLEGDADIYVSDKTPTPTYYPESYEYHSATCGIDSVYISRTFKRPLAVGIYGHASHSRFLLEVYKVPESESDKDQNSRVDGDNSVVNEERGDDGRNKERGRRATERGLRHGLWAFLEVFEMFFL